MGCWWTLFLSPHPQYSTPGCCIWIICVCIWICIILYLYPGCCVCFSVLNLVILMVKLIAMVIYGDWRGPFWTSSHIEGKCCYGLKKHQALLESFDWDWTKCGTRRIVVCVCTYCETTCQRRGCPWRQAPQANPDPSSLSAPFNSQLGQVDIVSEIPWFKQEFQQNFESDTLPYNFQISLSLFI